MVTAVSSFGCGSRGLVNRLSGEASNGPVRIGVIPDTMAVLLLSWLCGREDISRVVGSGPMVFGGVGFE